MILTFAGSIAVAATKTALTVVSTANIRPRILRYKMSTDGVPSSDAAAGVGIQRFTAAGTTTAVTAGFTDPSDSGVTLVVTAGKNATVEPTYSGSAVDTIFFNPRLLVDWKEYDRDSHIILPATAANGVGFQMTTLGGAVGNLQVSAWVQQ